MRRIQVQITVLLTLVALIAGALALIASTASAQQPTQGVSAQVAPPTGKGAAQTSNHPLKSGTGAAPVGAALPQPAAPLVVLYDQVNNLNTTATNSQQFEAANAPFNDQTADDFAIPVGQSWQVSEVDAQGQYFNGTGPAASFNVYFYSSVTSGTYAIPGAAVYTATAQAYVNTAGLFAITLTSPAVLPGSATNYFVSVQAVQNFTPAGQWGWTDRTVQSNSGAAWRNPGGGFGPACVNWDKRTFCVGDPAAPDQGFRLVGNIVGGATATTTATATPAPQVCNTTPITIVDAAPANPYPSNIVISGLTGNITNVQVAVNGINHTFPDDIDMLLVGPGGQSTLLMSDAGGGVDITGTLLLFQDGAPPLPDSTIINSGTYTPTNYGTGDTFVAPAPAGPYSSTLSVFNGTAPNGTWSLYIVDDLGGDFGAVTNGWCLLISTSAGGGTPTTTPTVQATPTRTATSGVPTNTPTVGATATCAPQAGGWTTGQPLPTTVTRSVGVYFPANGKVYGMGGRTSDAAGSDRTNPLEYTPGGAWVNKAGVYPDNQVNNMACGVITVGGTPYIYCVGGSAAGAATATARVFRYNPATDVVSAVAGDDWPGNAGGTVLPGGFAVTGNKLYILGGFNINVAMTNQIWEYDPNGGTHWTQKVNLPVTRGYIPATGIGGMIYTGGGSDYTTTVIDTADSFKFDPAANTIVAIANIPRATGETRAVNVGGTMWVLGGGRVAPNPSNEVDIYNPGTNTWTTGTPFPTARRNFTADSDGTRVWTAGGYDSSGTTLLDVTENYSPSVVCGTVTVTPTAPAASPTRTTGPTNTGTPPPVASATRTATTGATSTRTVTATPQPTACALTFNDVPVGSTFYTFIRCLACRGIVGGYPCGGPGEPCPGNYYRPNNNVTRGQVSKIVSESAGFNDAVPSTQQTFEDVPPGSTFHLWVERLSVRGIISGYPCGGPFEPCVSPGNRPYFRPNNNVTRGQLSKITSGAAGWTETPTSQTFEDAPPGSTFYVYIERMASRGIISGYPCGSSAFEPCVAPANRPYFRPNNNATRGQMAKIAASAFFPNCQTPAVAPAARPAPGQPANQ